MEAARYPKLIEGLPPVEGVITMGCQVHCPYLPSRFREDRGLDDPTGQGDEAFILTAKRIEEKILALKERLAMQDRA